MSKIIERAESPGGSTLHLAKADSSLKKPDLSDQRSSSSTSSSSPSQPETPHGQISGSLKAFTFTPADNFEDDQHIKTGEKILEPISSTSSFADKYHDDGKTSEGYTIRNRKFSIGTSSVIPTLLNAQLNNIKLFNFDDGNEEGENELGIGQKPKTCLEHNLSRLSTALMTKKQLGKITTGIRDIERTLNHINIRSKIVNILIITKLHDQEPITWAHRVINYLLSSNNYINLYLQYELWNNPYFIKENHFHECEKNNRIHFWYDDKCAFKPETIDLMITFGGDGTVLYGSWLFQQIIPPVLSFSLGSLGFLTEFDVQDYKNILLNIMENGYQCSIRMRFECTIMRSNDPNKLDADLKNDIKSLGRSPLGKPTHSIFEFFTVFNEVVIDRGPNSQMTSIELFGDRDSLTTAEADGLIISTPSGSTAYSLSAGGSLVHPEIPGILISPICPHTLSFRPLIIPESTILRLGVPYNARSTAWCSFDGKNRVELKKGDFLTVTASRFPLPCIKQSTSKNAWFERLSETLNWNERKLQKPFMQI
ncbi:hypothetical protein WICMUC_004431 [Wickerhamomyces mucosus]|uniref:NAD(+) kinase n=1 Tax=Wickerhamomyces mucosus TaxID=1378264 RepID=A0A9P8PI14_9ASCO|nr:hypothetical protein WICMUC_004431 [Wickerhamomyces mucosus]